MGPTLLLGALCTLGAFRAAPLSAAPAARVSPPASRDPAGEERGERGPLMCRGSGPHREAIQRAIDAAARAGGGVVALAAGARCLLDARLVLAPRVTLEGGGVAVLEASGLPPGSHLVVGRGLERAAVRRVVFDLAGETGVGALDLEGAVAVEENVVRGVGAGATEGFDVIRVSGKGAEASAAVVRDNTVLGSDADEANDTHFAILASDGGNLEFRGNRSYRAGGNALHVLGGPVDVEGNLLWGAWDHAVLADGAVSAWYEARFSDNTLCKASRGDARLPYASLERAANLEISGNKFRLSGCHPDAIQFYCLACVGGVRLSSNYLGGGVAFDAAVRCTGGSRDREWCGARLRGVSEEECEAGGGTCGWRPASVGYHNALVGNVLSSEFPVRIENQSDFVLAANQIVQNPCRRRRRRAQNANYPGDGETHCIGIQVEASHEVSGPIVIEGNAIGLGGRFATGIRVRTVKGGRIAGLVVTGNSFGGARFPQDVAIDLRAAPALERAVVTSNEVFARIGLAGAGREGEGAPSGDSVAANVGIERAVARAVVLEGELAPGASVLPGLALVWSTAGGRAGLAPARGGETARAFAGVAVEPARAEPGARARRVRYAVAGEARCLLAGRARRGAALVLRPGEATFEARRAGGPGKDEEPRATALEDGEAGAAIRCALGP